MKILSRTSDTGNYAYTYFYYKDDNGYTRFHNENDLPARIHTEFVEFSWQEWYEYGKLHRLTGPAFIRNDGRKIWSIRGKQIGRSEDGYTKEQFEQYKKLIAFL